MKKILSLFMVISLFLGVSGCSNENKTGDSNTSLEEEKKELVVGDTGEAEGIKVTVNSTRVDEGTDFYKPDEGEVWFVMDITLKNTTDQDFSSSSVICYELKDGDGRSMDITIGADLNGSLDTTVPAGEKIVGEIAFSVAPEGELFLTFTPTFSNNKVEVKVR